MHFNPTLIQNVDSEDSFTCKMYTVEGLRKTLPDVQQAHVVIVTLKILHKNIYSPKTERFLKENTSISNYDAEKLQSSVWYNGQV